MKLESSAGPYRAEVDVTFVWRAVRDLACGSRILAFGLAAAPCLLIALCAKAADIHIAEASQARLALMYRWLSAAAANPDMRSYASRVIQAECGDRATEKRVSDRLVLMQRLVTHCMLANPSMPDPLGHTLHMRYHCVVASLDPFAENRPGWSRQLRNLTSVIAPTGAALIAVHGSRIHRWNLGCALSRSRSARGDGAENPVAPQAQGGLLRSVS